MAFIGRATDVVLDDTNGVRDVFVYDTGSMETRRLSVSDDGVEGDDDSWRPVVSGDAGWIAFDSDATTLVAGDTNGQRDIFVVPNPLAP